MEPSSKTKINYVLVNDEFNDTEISIYDYTDKSIAMLCDEKFGRSFAENLKTIGTYNGKLKIGKGWVFAKSKYSNLNQLITDIMEHKIKGNVPVDYSKTETDNVSGPLGPLMTEPAIIKEFKKFVASLNTSKNKNTHISGDKTYLWGETNIVESTLSEMDKISNVIQEIRTEKFTMFVIKN